MAGGGTLQSLVVIKITECCFWILGGYCSSLDGLGCSSLFHDLLGCGLFGLLGSRLGLGRGGLFGCLGGLLQDRLLGAGGLLAGGFFGDGLGLGGLLGHRGSAVLQGQAAKFSYVILRKAVGKRPDLASRPPRLCPVIVSEQKSSQSSCANAQHTFPLLRCAL